MKRENKTRQAVVGWEDEDDDDYGFRSTEDDEDFNLFGNKNSKRPSNNKGNNNINNSNTNNNSFAVLSATSTSTAAATKPHHIISNNTSIKGKGNSSGGFPFFPANSVSKVAASATTTGLFAKTGNQKITGLLNQTGLTQGDLNGSIILGDHSIIAVYIQ